MLDKIKKTIFQKYFDKLLANSHKPIKDYTMPSCAGSAAEILSQMTLEEKISYISGVDSFSIGAIPRLGLPAFWMSDATSGIRGWDAPVTCFPSAVAMAGTWNRLLIQKTARCIADEARALGITVLLGPGVNIARVPTCGRNFEYMGEDPYLAGEIAAAYVRGAQSGGVITTVKHFACNNSDFDRHKSNSVVDEKTLNELYFPAFRKAVVDGGSLGVMTSYNQLNGEYASQNKYSVGDILRKKWGFRGMVVSDWNSLYDTARPLKCGVDIEMPGPVWFSPEKVRKVLDDGQISISDIDSKVYDILYALEKIGALSRPVADASLSVGSAKAAEIARETAVQGIALLKNSLSLLPLSPIQLKKVMIAGSMAGNPPTGGGGSSFVTPSRHVSTLEEELHDRIPGLKFTNRIEKDVDVAIIETGFGKLLESECYDRPYRLPAKDRSLIAKVIKSGLKCIVIVHSGGSYSTDEWADDADVILNSYYLGEFGSQALCDVILGDVNPSGKLPFTMTRHYLDNLSIRNYVLKPSAFSIRRCFVGQGNPRKRHVANMRYIEGVKVGYRICSPDNDCSIFPFGHGLSYSSFCYGDASVQQYGGEFKVTVSVSNTGSRSGQEVAQLYVHDQDAQKCDAYQELKGFEKVTLDPGKSCEVSFLLRNEDFAHYDPISRTWKVNNGNFDVRIGSSSADIRVVVPLRL